MKNFSDCLKAAMVQADMNQVALSEKSGCSKAAISQYLSGKNIPGPAKVKALADALGISAAELLGEEAAVALPIGKITCDLAAQCMGKSHHFVRIGLQKGILPFGNAVPGTGNRWDYYISHAKFREYVGPERFDSFFGLTEPAERG